MENDVRQSSTDRYAVSQAYRWKAERDKAMQELRQLKERSRDTTTSAYDLLPEEERDAIAWVREHGGLDIVKKLLDWVVGHCSTKQQLDFDFWLSGRVMYELGFDEDMADRDEVERRLLARLMPEGMCWPVFEDGTPVKFGDVVSDGDETGRVYYVTFDTVNPVIIGFTDETPDQDPGTWLEVSVNDGERVKRPAPKVYDADGVEIRVGDVLYSIETGDSVTVDSIEPGNPWFATTDGTLQHCTKFTHRAPVLAADGEPLEVGQTVWSVNDGREYKVVTVDSPVQFDTTSIKVDDGKAVDGVWIRPDNLTHQRPVLDADGVPIKKGDTVWHKGTGEKYRVFRFSDEENRVWGESDLGSFFLDCSMLTHTRPEHDSWERIEEDAGCTATKYNERRGTIFTTKQQVARDLVRRCRALAERERGE